MWSDNCTMHVEIRTSLMSRTSNGFHFTLHSVVRQRTCTPRIGAETLPDLKRIGGFEICCCVFGVVMRVKNLCNLRQNEILIVFFQLEEKEIG
jgi:hypothetical protein